MSSLCLIAGAQLIVFPVYLFVLVPRSHVQQSRFVLGEKNLLNKNNFRKSNMKARLKSNSYACAHQFVPVAV